MAPICLSNAVIAVGANGVVKKFDLNGELLFQAKPKGFDGASAMSGRLTDKCIFMTETLFEAKRKSLVYHLCIIEVCGAAPLLKARFNIPQPLGISRTSDHIFVIGAKETARLSISDHCKD